MRGWLARLPRRLVTTLVVLVAAVVVTAFLPVVVVLVVLADFARGDWNQRPRLRATTFLWALLLNEIFGMISLFLLWVGTGFGLAMHTSGSYALHGAVHGRWTRNIVAAIETCFSTTVRYQGLEVVEPAPVVVLARHISLLDAVLPSVVVTETRWHAPRHVFMRELRFDPCIDTLGHRTPNHLVDREQGGPRELAAITAVGETLNERGSGVIFPEGGFRTPERFERAIVSLEKRNPALAERARPLRHTMPPRPGGAYAMITAAPGADVVVMANRGFDGVSTVADIFRAGKLPDIDVRLTRHDRADVPEDPDAFAIWLFDRFAEVDDWIDRRQVACSPRSDGLTTPVDVDLRETSHDAAR